MRKLKSRILVATLLIFTGTFVLLQNMLKPNYNSAPIDVEEIKYSVANINRFESRLLHLNNRCTSLNTSTVGHPKILLYSKLMNTVYCPVPQIYSTWLKQAMLTVESKPLVLKQRYNVSTLQAIHAEALSLNLPYSVLLKPESLGPGSQHRLILVRDPWQRLIAAYVDMVVRQHKYQTQCARFTDIFSRELKFEGFLRCLIHYANGSQSLHELDLKLSPINTLCSTCRIPYTVIVRYESLSADLYDYITTIDTKAKKQLLQLYHQSSIPGSFSAQVVHSYMDSLNKKVIQDIQQIYALDFKLFGYLLK